MTIINIENVSKAFADKIILQNASYGIEENSKVGIIGINGTGKTTLLKMIAGLEETDEGQITRKNGLRIAYLPQNPEFPEKTDILTCVLQGSSLAKSSITGGGSSGLAMGSNYEMDEWTRESEAKNILNRLGITDHAALIDHLSGGQKKRVALARTLMSPADVLILDEPTNHIDNEMATWLEEYLRKFRGAIIMVTHDRYFLDRVTNQILEVSHGNLYGYAVSTEAGNAVSNTNAEGSAYTRFLELKAEREERELASERKRQTILRGEIEWAKRGARARTTKQNARLERLELLKNASGPISDASVAMEAVTGRMGKKTIELKNVSKGFGERRLITDFSYIVLRGQRLGIIGPNGCGKSTLMNLLAGQLTPDSGSIEVGETIKIGYFAQEEAIMDPDQRVIDYIRDVAEYIPTKDGTITASQMLERFLFDGSMQYSLIRKLSGGERRRLYLLRVLAQGANVLLLDEPTNDLDIATLTILEDFLETFNGIIITVSHDRYFLDAVVDRIFAFEDGHLQQYEGGYTEYLEAKARREAATIGSGQVKGASAPKTTSASSKTAATADSSKDWKEARKQNQPIKLKFTYKEQREFETIDDDIAALEEKLANIEAQMEEYASSYTKLTELTAEKEAVEAELEEKMERWEYLNDLAEKIEAQK